MLYSPSHDIGFAHYPKTGGHSLGAWFRSAFPDAAFVEPPEMYDVSHLPVRASLVGLGLCPPPGMRLHDRLGRYLAGSARRLGAGAIIPGCRTRIIGVMREPFDILVSLFEYWRHYPFETEPDTPLTVIARRGTFSEFVHAAVVDGMLWSYDVFFDAYGPAWLSTRLIDFHDLDAGLAAVCEEFGIPAAAPLQRLNVGPDRDRKRSRYEAEAGSLMKDVHRHFRWYYDHAARIMVRGKRCGG